MNITAHQYGMVGDTVVVVLHGDNFDSVDDGTLVRAADARHESDMVATRGIVSRGPGAVIVQLIGNLDNFENHTMRQLNSSNSTFLR